MTLHPLRNAVPNIRGQSINMFYMKVRYCFYFSRESHPLLSCEVSKLKFILLCPLPYNNKPCYTNSERRRSCPFLVSCFRALNILKLCLERLCLEDGSSMRLRKSVNFYRPIWHHIPEKTLNCL